MEWNDWSVIVLKNFIDPVYLFSEVPWERGQYNYIKPGLVNHQPLEKQVEGSISRYNHPRYKEIQYFIKSQLEKTIGEVLYPSYYYDRFYFKGQDLEVHVDRPACEVSVSLHCSNNLDYNWPIWFQTPEETNIPLITNPGDAVVYKGCERPHWREPMKGNHKSYYHQIFFHYVRRDGPYIEHAYDMCNNINSN